MDMLFEIKRFLKKVGFADIVMIGATAYIIYRILKRKKKKTNFNQEIIKVIEEDDGQEIIYDTDSKIYSIIKDFDIKFQSKDLNEIKRHKRMESLRNRIEKLNLRG